MVRCGQGEGGGTSVDRRPHAKPSKTSLPKARPEATALATWSGEGEPPEKVGSALCTKCSMNGSVFLMVQNGQGSF